MAIATPNHDMEALRRELAELTKRVDKLEAAPKKPLDFSSIEGHTEHTPHKLDFSNITGHVEHSR